MKNMNQQSLKVNMLLNGIKGIMSIAFPLITFPYISRVLGVNNLGKYNFASSIVSYFVLFSGLGISTYSIREGARIRENSKEISLFTNEIFTINVCSTVVSYVSFLILILLTPKFSNYIILMIILSLQIVFKTIGIEWIYSIYEDYIYITVRSIIFQILSIVMLFLLVKGEKDVEKYAIITVISAVGSNVFNYLHSHKYCEVKLTKTIDWKRHLKPIMILFAMSVAVTIYVNSDITILGFLSDDFAVGIYSVSTKVYSVIKTLLSSILIVSIPRLSAALGKSESEDFCKIAEDIYKSLLTVIIPSIVGIIVLRREIIIILSGADYLKATSSLFLLSIALLFCLGSWFWGQCILIPLKFENIVFQVTIVSALVNILMNFLLIPIWKENAAAFTTIIAEGISFAWCYVKGKQFVDMSGIFQLFLKIIFGCISIFFVSLIVHSFISSVYLRLFLIILLSIINYFVIEFLLKNIVICSIITSVKERTLRNIRSWRNIKKWKI